MGLLLVILKFWSPSVNPYLTQLQGEIELRRAAEMRCNSYNVECSRLRSALDRAQAGLSETEGAVQYMVRGTSQYYDEARVLRLKSCAGGMSATGRNSWRQP